MNGHEFTSRNPERSDDFCNKLTKFHSNRISGFLFFSSPSSSSSSLSSHTFWCLTSLLTCLMVSIGLTSYELRNEMRGENVFSNLFSTWYIFHKQEAGSVQWCRRGVTVQGLWARSSAKIGVRTRIHRFPINMIFLSFFNGFNSKMLTLWALINNQCDSGMLKNRRKMISSNNFMHELMDMNTYFTQTP
jgi:hypothetical protein